MVEPLIEMPPPHPLRADEKGYILHRFDDESLAAMRELTAALREANQLKVSEAVGKARASLRREFPPSFRSGDPDLSA